jgi:hypothetical protein
LKVLQKQAIETPAEAEMLGECDKDYERLDISKNTRIHNMNTNIANTMIMNNSSH